MSEHYIIVADQGHLRVFLRRRPTGQQTPSLQEVHAMDFPAGVRSYTDHDSDMAGRFQGSNTQARGAGAPTARMGMSIDERLPMQREEDRRGLENLVEAIDTFLQHQPDSTWDFAAGPALHHAVLDRLQPAMRQRLQRSVVKDLVHQPREELEAHFADA